MTRMLPANPDVIAPDGSEVRILAAARHGSMAHFSLTPGRISRAVRHQTVEELWFVLSGQGRMWLDNQVNESMHMLVAGFSFAILPGTSFQFRCDGPEPLRIIAVTMPPWPGDAEATLVQGAWDAVL